MPAPDDAAYRRIAADLRRAITSGELTPGAEIPSRRYLARQYGVSSGAVHDAIQVLRTDGLVEGYERHRLTVAHPPAVRSLADPAAPWPYGTGERRLDRAPIPGGVAELLGVAEGTRVQREQTELLDPDGRTSHALVRYVRRARTVGRSTVMSTEARAAAAGEAGLLGVAIGSVLLVVPVVRYGRDGQPAAVDVLLLPADRWRVRPG